MDLHLDDRRLHGRILHGWGGRLGPERYVLVSLDEPATALRASYAVAAAEGGAVLVLCRPGVGDSPAPQAGDFWLADSTAAALALLRAGVAYERLVVVGLRDADGVPLAPDFQPGPASRADLLAVSAAGPRIEWRAFPGDPGLALGEAELTGPFPGDPDPEAT